MNCYQCGCELSDKNFCTNCGADVALYKRILSASNLLYNEGLEKAQVRDLSGAIDSLRQSLKFNKNNVEARNLLGLVYFEMGEPVAALSEWVMSKNLRPQKNIADDYINMVQANAARLESINQTIKKYNQALYYCTQGSKDLALIQLKKVLSLNPRFVKAHLLLALVYMDAEDWDKARKELNKCTAVDKNNTQALRYLKEVDLVTHQDEGTKSAGSVGKKKNKDAVRYQSDNELIIQPVNVKEPKSGKVTSLLNLIIGLVIGVAAMYFLVVPAAVSNVRSEANAKIAEIGSQSDIKTSTITELESQIKNLTSQRDELQAQLDGYVGSGGTLSIIDNLLNAASSYLKNADVVQTGADLETIAANSDITQTTEAFQELYNTLLGTIGPELSQNYYAEGFAAYKNKDYETAIQKLTQAVYYDAGNMDALYNLGNAYKDSGDTENAIAAYDKVIELFPDTDRARRAQRYKDELVE